jgi:hypothetical protein
VKLLNIVSHRGFWKTPDEKNTMKSFRRSLMHSFGIETDVRDYCGNLVISHDVPNRKSIALSDFLDLYQNISNQTEETLSLAINIKSDGLRSKLESLMSEYNIIKYFVFDMSIPDMMDYQNSSIAVFARMSEYELNPLLIQGVSGIWVDSFTDNYVDPKVLNSYLKNGSELCIVSPELHGNSYIEYWSLLNDQLNHKQDVMLCTDYPDKAEIYFNEK